MPTTYSAGKLSVTTLNATGASASLTASSADITTLNTINVAATNFNLTSLENFSVKGTLNPPTTWMNRGELDVSGNRIVLLPGSNGSWPNYQGSDYKNQNNSKSSPALTASTAESLKIFRSTQIPSGYKQESAMWHMQCDEFHVYQLVLQSPNYGNNGSCGLPLFELVKYDRFTGEVVLSSLNNTNMFNDVYDINSTGYQVDGNQNSLPGQRMKNIFAMNGNYLYLSSSTPNSIQGIIKVDKRDFRIIWTCSDPCKISDTYINNNVFMDDDGFTGSRPNLSFGMKHLTAIPHPDGTKKTILIFGNALFAQYFTSGWDTNVNDVFTDRFNAYLHQGHIFAMVDSGANTSTGNSDLTKLWDFPLGPRILQAGDKLPVSACIYPATTMKIIYPIIYGAKDYNGTLIDSLTPFTNDASGASIGGVDATMGPYFTIEAAMTGPHNFCSFDRTAYDAVYNTGSWTKTAVYSSGTKTYTLSAPFLGYEVKFSGDSSGNDYYYKGDVSGNLMYKTIFQAATPYKQYELIFSANKDTKKQNNSQISVYKFPKTWNNYTLLAGTYYRNGGASITSDAGGVVLPVKDLFIGQNLVKTLSVGTTLGVFDAFNCNYWGSGGYGITSYDPATQILYYPTTNANITPYDDYLQAVARSGAMDIRNRSINYNKAIKTAIDSSGYLDAAAITAANNILTANGDNVSNAAYMSPRAKRMTCGSVVALSILTGALNYHYTTQAYDSFTFGAMDFPNSWPNYESLGTNNDNVCGLSITTPATTGGAYYGYTCAKNGIIARLRLDNYTKTITPTAKPSATYLANTYYDVAESAGFYASMCMEGINSMTIPTPSYPFYAPAATVAGTGFQAAISKTHYCIVNNNQSVGSILWDASNANTFFTGFILVDRRYTLNTSAGLICLTSLLNMSNTDIDTSMVKVVSKPGETSYSLIPTGTRYVVGVNLTTNAVDWITPIETVGTAGVTIFPNPRAIDVAGLTASENLIYVGSNQSGKLNILNETNGNVVKIFTFDEAADGGVIAVGNILYLGGGSVRWFNPGLASSKMRMLTIGGV